MFKDKCKNPSYVFEHFKERVEKESENMGMKPSNRLLIRIFAFLPHMLDFRVRLWDFWRNRSYGGRLEKICIKGHSPVALLLPIGLLYFIFFGPSGGNRNGIDLKWIILQWLLFVAAVFCFRLVSSQIKCSKNQVEQDNSNIPRRINTLDFLRISLWCLVAAVITGGFSRGFPAHALFFLFILILWGCFAYGSHIDCRNTDKKNEMVSTHILKRFPWVSVILFTVGLVLFYLYLLPLHDEKVKSILWFILYASIVSVIFLIIISIFIKNCNEKQRYGSLSLWFQLTVLSMAGVLVWYTGGLKEVDNQIYRHVMIPLTIVMLVVPLTMASVLARTVFHWRLNLIGKRLYRLIKHVEVFASPTPPPLDSNKLFTSVLVTARHILMLMFPAGLVILVLPYYLKDALDLIGGSTLLITFIFLAFAKVHGRLDHLISIYQGMFFHGVQVVVSTLVIILGVTRLIDIGYVSYIVEASPLTLLTYILVAYLMLWFFEYWINRIFDEELLSLINPRKKACSMVRFKYKNEESGMRSSISARNRRVQLHGNGRLVVVGEREWFRKYPGIDTGSHEFECLQILCSQGKEREEDVFSCIEKVFGEKDIKKKIKIKREIEKKNYDDYKQSNGIRFQFYNRFDLLDHLIENAVLSDFEFKNESSSNKDKKEKVPERKRQSMIRNNLRWHIHDLRKQYVSYYAILTMILAFGIVSQVMAFMAIADPPALSVDAEYSGANTETNQGQNLFNLRDHIFIKSDKSNKYAHSDTDAGVIPKPEPVILVAASGGGTRAALYTVSLLQGLSELELLDNVKLVSGVSGGGAALAYFCGHRDELIKTGRGQVWADFYDAVSKDYIVRCLQGAGERRIGGGLRLGRILEEGFQEYFFSGKEQITGNREIGVLFNIAVAGEVHCKDLKEPDFAQWVQDNPERARSWAAGTRLIVSNTAEANILKKDIYHVPRNGLRYTSIVRPDVSLAVSAALNANFPPVFSNAAVDIENSRYWVTDGGAVDNRGVISLLYVLKEALEKKDNGGMGEGRGQDENQFIYPDIHILIADASATTFDYSPKRGFGAVFGASTKLASGLIHELEKEVADIYSEISPENKIYIHELSMPLPMRSRGGLGTHWMMPLMAKFKSCNERDKNDDQEVRLTRNQIIRAIAGLHQKDGEDNIGEIIIQDPWPIEMLRDDEALDDLRMWYSNDAAYLRGYTLQSGRCDEDNNKDCVKSHRGAWEKFKNSVRSNAERS